MSLWPTVRFESVRFTSWFHESMSFSDDPHGAPDASCEAVTNQLASWKERYDGRDTGGFDVHECICALSTWVTRAWRSHHVRQLRRLDLKGESTEVFDACEQCGNVVGGRSLVFVHIVARFDVFLLACFLQLLCLYSWSCVHMTRQCVDSGGCGLILIILFQRQVVSVFLFVVHHSV